MKHALACLLLGALGCAAPREAAAPTDARDALTLERILATPSPTGTAPASPRWAPDGRHLAFLWNDAGLPQREVWLVGADGHGLRRLTSASEGESGVGELAWMPDSEALVYRPRARPSSRPRARTP